MEVIVIGHWLLRYNLFRPDLNPKVIVLCYGFSYIVGYTTKAALRHVRLEARLFRSPFRSIVKRNVFAPIF